MFCDDRHAWKATEKMVMLSPRTYMKQQQIDREHKMTVEKMRNSMQIFFILKHCEI
jgi:hypothetical protein